jgi:hypothetical protein
MTDSARSAGLIGPSFFMAAGTADMAEPTASPCVVTGKECTIDADGTTDTGMP